MPRVCTGPCVILCIERTFHASGATGFLSLFIGGLPKALLGIGDTPDVQLRAVTFYEGVPTIRDGDNVNIDGVNIRLEGIDACELGQAARLANRSFDCGIWARDHFREMIGSRSVRCESRERDFYDRPLAICYTGARNLNRALVENGYVFPYARESDYRKEAAEAQAARRGIWLFEEVEDPSDYRRRRRNQ